MGKPLIDKIREYKPCEDAVAWLGKRDLVTAWAECPRADWMLWVCSKIGPETAARKAIYVQLARGFAERAERAAGAAAAEAADAAAAWAERAADAAAAWAAARTAGAAARAAWAADAAAAEAAMSDMAEEVRAVIPHPKK